MVFYKLFVRYIGENPGIFTEGSCYLPWIAESYGLQLGKGYDTSCKSASGMRESIPNHECRARNGRKCLFDPELTDEVGVDYSQCVLGSQSFDHGQIGYVCLTFPSFKVIEFCCTRYPDDCEDLLKVYKEVVRTPDFLKAFSKCGRNLDIFTSTCANDCPGVDASDIVAGGAAVFATTSLPAVGSFELPIIPGLLGVAGIGVIVIISQQWCLGPIFCTNASGQCCHLVFTNRGLQCPTAC